MQIELPFRTKASLGGRGILTDKDMEDLSAACVRVYHLMKDGRWYNPWEIDTAAGHDNRPAREGLRRMRELRKLFEIESRRAGRTWQYRLTEKSK